MSQIVIGKSGGKNVSINLDILIRTRLLVQANSGGGKSWLLRRIAEQMWGKIPVIIIDPEGEFASLREKFGYVLVGKGGETPADPRSAALLAVKLLELRASAVCDLYEMKPSERHHWVRVFLEAAINAPKKLWRPTIFMVDEAHGFCPQKGAGESEAKDAMIAMNTRGRKRRFCSLWATQRLAKVDKDASSEMQNRLIGPTFEDVDLKRAADLLSIRDTDRREFDKQMRVLEPGNFYALGRAICTERLLVQVGPIETTHEIEDARHGGFEPPPTPAVLKGMLPQLADLPKSAEQKALTEAELRKEIIELKRQVREGVRAAPRAASPKEVEYAVKAATARLTKEIEGRDRAIMRKVSIETANVIRDVSKEIAGLADHVSEFLRLPVQLSGGEIQKAGGGQTKPETKLSTQVGSHPRPNHHHEVEVKTWANLKAGARKMLTVLAQFHPETKTRDELGALTGFAPGGGTFGEYMRMLARAGFIEETGEAISITEEGLAAVGAIPPRPDTTVELVAMWKSKFKAGAGKMLDVLVEDYPGEITREELGERAGFRADGGTYGEYLRMLTRARVAVVRGNMVKAAEALFP